MFLCIVCLLFMLSAIPFSSSVLCFFLCFLFWNLSFLVFLLVILFWNLLLLLVLLALRNSVSVLCFFLCFSFWHLFLLVLPVLKFACSGINFCLVLLLVMNLAGPPMTLEHLFGRPPSRFCSPSAFTRYLWPSWFCSASAFWLKGGFGVLKSPPFLRTMPGQHAAKLSPILGTFPGYPLGLLI